MENINNKVGTANTTYVGVGHGLQIRYGPHAGRLVGLKGCWLQRGLFLSHSIDFHRSPLCL